MPRFIESIKLLNGTFFNLPGHQYRVERTYEKFFPQSKIPDLQHSLSEIEIPRNGLFKCRVVYDQQIQRIECLPYQLRLIYSLKIVQSELIEYGYKSENRDELNELYKSKAAADDIIIIKGGLVTDSSYANLVFKKREKWITPSSYLLNGTMRQRLVTNGEIFCEPITLSDIRKFEKVKLINSMMGFEGPEIEISKIIF